MTQAPSPSDSHDSPRLERALEAYIRFQTTDLWSTRQEFLAEHQDLIDLLEPMLEDGLEDASEAGRGTESSAPIAKSSDPRLRGGLRRLGDFDIHAEIGRGGMGVVYEARQRSVDRPVALKVLTSQFTAGSQAIARFHREATLAGRLSHPGIVEVFTVGSEDDTHFFAMELVDGLPLDEMLRAVREEVDADTAKLAELDGIALRSLVLSCTNERRDRQGSHLRSSHSGEASESSKAASDHAIYERSYIESMIAIALQVADALHHSHCLQVLHRDVKPSNVMLRRDGRVVLTDFGLAREEDLPSMTLSGEFLGTPYYVSPEQAQGNRSLVGPATDVFSVGVMLYEMVTLHRPFEGATSAAVIHKLIHDEPVEPQKRNRAIPADLAAVIMHCLQKDHLDRYQDAGELAADLRALLEFRPVQARKISAGTRVARWTQRNRALAITALVGSFLLLLGLIISTLVFYRQATSLEQSQEETLAVNEFLVDKLILASDPGRHYGKEPTVEQVLVSATKEVAASFAGKPMLEATVRQTLGKAWARLDRFEEALEQLERSRAIRTRELPASSERRIDTELELAMVLQQVSRFKDSKKILVEVLPIARAIFGEGHELFLRAELDLALANRKLDRMEEAERQMRRHLARSTLYRGADHRKTLYVQHYLAGILEIRGNFDEAEELYRGVMERRIATLRPDHVDLYKGAADLSQLLINRDKLVDAQHFAELALAGSAKIFGEQSLAYLNARAALATIHNFLGRKNHASEHYATAEKMFREDLILRAALYGKDSVDYARGLNNIGVLLCDQGKWKDAVPIFEACGESYSAALGPRHRETLIALSNLAMSLIQKGDVAEALRIAKRCVEASPSTFGKKHHIHAQMLGILGACLRAEEQYAEAIAALQEAYGILQESLGLGHARTRRLAQQISVTYQRMGDEKKSSEWREISEARSRELLPK